MFFDEKMENNGSKGFLLTTKFYKSINGPSILDPKKRKMEGKEDVNPEGTAVNNKE